MKTAKIVKLNPCHESIVYMRTQKSSTEAWMNCERGDWMLWIAKRLKIDDKKLTLAKALCVKQVEHLMEDQRSKDALQACFDYVNGKITQQELRAAADAAAYAAADDAAYAADAAAYAAAADATYAAAAAAYAAAAAATYAAKKDSLRKSADICREYLTEDVLNAYKKLR